MTAIPALEPAKEMSRNTWRMDVLAALAATLVMLAAGAASGFATLTDMGGDNDSLLRLVEVRDLLGGQGWFDLHQYRMGPEGGFVMHWSRLVDAPLAALVLAAKALAGSAGPAETAARVLWPALLYGLTLFFLIRAARRFGGEAAVLPATVISAAALFFTGIFEAGALDHHNVQLMLTVAALSLLLDARESRPAAALAGACTALTLAVGMETAPYVAAIGLCVAGLLVADAEGERRVAAGFGLGFAGVCAAAFLATVPPSAWGVAACDAFSAAQLAPAAIAGLGLAAIASLPALHAGRARLLVALGLLGALLAIVVAVFFPQCLASPYAGVDARLRSLWLDHVTEAQSLRQLLASDPVTVAARYATPLLALMLVAHRLSQGGWRRQDSLVAVLLAMAFAVSVWQVRGSTFSVPLAAIPLAAWVGAWRRRVEAGASRGTTAKMLAAWLASVNLIWSGAANATASMLEGRSAGQGPAQQNCQRAADFTALAAQPGTTVLAVSNLGSPILAYTGHRVLAGPYHRNVEGNLIVLDALTGPAEAARNLVQNSNIGLVALCRGNAETAFLAGKSPDGLLAMLVRGTVPAWLEPVAGTAGQPLELYRVRPTE